MLAGCFLDSCTDRLILKQWEGPPRNYDTSCFYQGATHVPEVPDVDASRATSFRVMINKVLRLKKTFDGCSLPFLGVGISCVALLALYMKDANVSVLYQAAFAERQKMNAMWKVLVLFGEVVRTILLPNQVAAGAALQLSQSMDVADVIFSAFKATFLLQMDRTLYSLALSPEEKHAFQQQWHTLSSKVHMKIKRDPAIPNCVFLVDLSLLATLFLAPHFLKHHWSTSYDYQFQLREFINPLVYASAAVRVVLLQIAFRRMQSKPTGGVHHPCRGIRLAADMLMMAAAAAALRLVFRVLFAVDPVFDYSSINLCLTRADISACTCRD